MTKEEYLKQYDEIQVELTKAEIKAGEQKKGLSKSYLTPQVKYKKGDIIEDHFCRIKIKGCTIILSTSLITSPSSNIKYYGTRLKKDNTPFKNDEQGYIYESNIKKVIV